MKTIFYDKVSTTMDVALEHILNGLEEPSMILAKEQTHGKGREENKWFSPKGGLYASFIFPSIKSLSQEIITLFHYSSALAVLDTLKEMYDINARIKWPNDVLINEKKVSGILIEYIQTTSNYLMIGIGINVNHRTDRFPDEIRNQVTSLHEIVGKELEISKISNTMKLLIQEYTLLIFNSEIEQIINKFNKNCVQFNKTIVLNDKSEYYCKGVNNLGKLVLLTSTNKEKIVEIQESNNIISYF